MLSSHASQSKYMIMYGTYDCSKEPENDLVMNQLQKGTLSCVSYRQVSDV